MVRKIRAKLVLRLRSEGLSRRQIAAQGMSRHSVDAVIAAADAIGISYDDVAAVPDGEVYARLFPGRGEHHSVYAQPAWDEVHRELAKVGVTLKSCCMASIATGQLRPGLRRWGMTGSASESPRVWWRL